MMSRALATTLLFFALVSPTISAEIETLPNTAALEWQGELADRMMDSLHVYIERKIAESVEQRAARWDRDLVRDPPDAKVERSGRRSPTRYELSIAKNRERFQRIVGLVNQRSGTHLDLIAAGPHDVPIAEAGRFDIYQVRWPVFEGVEGEGLLLRPRERPKAIVIVLPDADQLPEDLAGLTAGLPTERQVAFRLAANGCLVIVPTLLTRRLEERRDPEQRVASIQSNREWIYRQAYQMGRHVIGYEVERALALVDRFADEDRLPLGIAGYGEGGLVAFYAAACDPRIAACLVSGYFQERSHPWTEPLERNVWSLLHEFGDAEIATLVAPRGLVVEHCRFPGILPPPAGKRVTIGQLETPTFSSVEQEFARINRLLPQGLQTRHLIDASGDELVGPWSEPALARFAEQLNVKPLLPAKEERLHNRLMHFDPAERQRRLAKQLETHVQKLVRESDHTRSEFFLGKADFQNRSLGTFVERTAGYRDRFWNENLGRLDDRPLPANPRSRKIYDRPKWTGYDVVLDVFPDVFAWGVLLVPKDLKPGERRPVVVCQHGRNGLPKDTIEGDIKFYHDFAAHLADRGLIVFAPHNPYRGEDRYRLLNRKANAVGATLFSFVLAQHEQILKWLGSLPQVDPERIAFYGLSYGGETAVRVPPLLPGYCLSICSADFNDWARKVASTDSRYSFMFTIEWEMPYFNLGSTFNYAEMVALLAPRPFMVERGHTDGVAPDEWVAYEYAKVRRLYDELGIGDRTDIEVFSGGHTINGQGTFRFLAKHLNWPMTVMGEGK
jgi:dienelactone hydrolase